MDVRARAANTFEFAQAAIVSSDTEFVSFPATLAVVTSKLHHLMELLKSNVRVIPLHTDADSSQVQAKASSSLARYSVALASWPGSLANLADAAPPPPGHEISSRLEPIARDCNALRHVSTATWIAANSAQKMVNPAIVAARGAVAAKVFGLRQFAAPAEAVARSSHSSMVASFDGCALSWACPRPLIRLCANRSRAFLEGAPWAEAPPGRQVLPRALRSDQRRCVAAARRGSAGTCAMLEPLREILALCFAGGASGPFDVSLVSAGVADSDLEVSLALLGKSPRGSNLLSGLLFDGFTQSMEHGHKVLPPCINVIQGDGIDINSMEEVYKAMLKSGWAASNVGFGSGGALLQKLNRDTQKCAFKCSYAKTGDGDVSVFKDPITDPGKQSKKGRLTLEKSESGSYITVTDGKGDPSKDLLVEIFVDGKLLTDDSFANIRKRAALSPEEVEVTKATGAAKMIDDPFSNLILLTDSYKFTHHLQYPPNTQTIYS
ncbi:unnamed protein product [Prorocentrum cordatum]|uniref:Nicotinamide phosphoribosyltransferase n=1 Tax=Prorocentrum cordatum TaxID=2364126 RepID=A0ABN9WVA8_9DINO|nr:unnamed protein product [Polarella glacialis]